MLAFYDKSLSTVLLALITNILHKVVFNCLLADFDAMFHQKNTTIKEDTSVLSDTQFS